jgi:hypothetical protein
MYTHTHTHIHILFKKSKIYIKTFKNAPTCFDHTIILREHILFLAKVIIYKHSVNYFVMLSLVLWQHVVFLCVSRALFGVRLVMVVRRMLCSVR